LSPTNVYENVGVFTVKLKLISPIGCEVTKTWPNLIKIFESPTAGFTFDPKEPNSFNNTVRFTDQSLNASSHLWTFDTIGVSLLQSPTFTFQDTGLYKVEQVVFNASGCTDTATVYIPIYPFINFFMPNAFTPNNDGLNDVFIPVGSFFGIGFYNFSIWNRWGERIFFTEDYATGWNGQKNNTGENAPPGVYAYTIDYIDGRGESKKLKGQCTLIR
jgi:gliding motility-associated-like protein